MKSAVLRELMVFVVMAALSAAQAAIAGESSACQGVAYTRGANIENKAELESAITKQLKILSSLQKRNKQSVSVIEVFASGNWNIIYVENYSTDPKYLFYSGNPLTSSYIASLAGELEQMGEHELKDLVLKKAPGIPTKLASCFARLLTKGRQGYVTQGR